MALPSTSGTGRCCASAGVVAGPSFSGLVVRGCEVGGVTILLVGSLAALVSYRRVGGRQAYEAARSQRRARHSPGPGVPIIADIVMTITLDPTLTSAAALGVIVLVEHF